MAWATARGIVGTLTEDTTGSVSTQLDRVAEGKFTRMKHTRIIAVDGCFHERPHPLTDNHLFTRAEKVRAI
jgi:hypothetical protein